MAMDSSYISTISALAGTVIGGLTSFVTSWLIQNVQARAARLATERTKREELYGRYVDNLALLCSFALSNEALDYSKLVNAFALKGRIMLLSTPAVVASAEASLKVLVDLYLGPLRSPAEMRQMMEDQSADFIKRFAETCREELQNLRVA